MKHKQGRERRVLVGWVSGLSLLAAIAMLAGCGSKPSAGPSAGREPTKGDDAAEKVGNAGHLLLDSIDHPAAAFHVSCRSLTNINPKFPMESGTKPEVGALDMEADVAPDAVYIRESKGGKKTETKAKKTDVAGWLVAKSVMMGSLMAPNFALALGSGVAQSAGSESVEGVATDRFDIDTSTASGTKKAGFEMAASLLGGKVKTNVIKGSVWVDKASGRLVKFNLDTEVSAAAGDSWNEHYEGVVTPK